LPPLKPPQKKGGLKFGKTLNPPPSKGSANMCTEKQAAEWLGVSVFTLRRIRKRGEIACYPIGGTYHYSIEQLETYLKSKELCPKSAFKSENTTSSSIPTPLSTKPDGTTLKLDKHAAHLYALKTLKKRK
jgi:excisionase family DNA binding protein